MVSNTIKENGYSSSYGPDNFTLIDGGNGQYSLAEKSTGTIVGHYSVKNGDLYKQDVITGNDVKVGATVTVEAPAGSYDVKIIDVD